MTASAETARDAAAGQEAAESGRSSEDEAIAEARRSGQKVEVTSLRGESRDVFATPEGRLEAREYLRPVRTRTGGVWKSVDTTLVNSASGAVTPRNATVGLEFSGGGEDALVRLQRAGRTLEIAWPGPVPVPRLDGDTATYTNLLPDVDLRLGAQADGFTQLLVVKSEQAAKSPELATLRMKLETEGLTVGETEQGGLEARDKGAQGIVFEASKPLMWDSSEVGTAGGRETAGAAPSSAKGASAPSADEGSAPRSDAPAVDEEPGAGDSARLAPVEVEVSGDGGELTLTPDQDVLAGPGTVYPVYIDPQWYSPKASSWTMASKYWANSPQWKFNGDSDEGLGYCNWYYCNPHDTKRLFYQVPVSAFAGKSILSAEFAVRNTWSASCDERSVELWRTKGISSSTTWNSQTASGFWADHLSTQTFAYGYEGCAAKDAEFNVKSAVQQAADNRWSTLTFGLRSVNESDALGWKRFSDDAYLRVTYNRPPSQIRMSQLVQEPGGACVHPDNPARTRYVPSLHAYDVKDPDGDNVAVEFRADWDSGDGKGFVNRWKSKTTTKSSGSDFKVTPTNLPPDRKVSWYARSWDGAQWSPWSWEGSATTCGVIYDSSEPAPPSVSSPHYPASTDTATPWTDGVGRYGTFTFDSPATDVTKYTYRINDQAQHTISTTGGAAKSIKTMPSKPGVNILHVQAFDAASRGSTRATYVFRVRSGQPDRLSWQLDEPAGASSVTGEGGTWEAELHGGAKAGAAGTAGGALGLDGIDDYAASPSPVLNTGKSFSVSLWAKLPTTAPQGAVAALAQPGQNTSGFEIYYSPSTGSWSFLRHGADASGSTVARASQPSCTAGDEACRAGRLDTWTHLVGVFDNPNQKLLLYIGGKLVGSAPFSTPWDARGGTMLGAASHYGTVENFFPGHLDEVQLFDYQLTAEQVTKLHGKSPVDTNRPAKLVWPLDENDSASRVVGRAQKVTAALRGGAQTGVQGLADKALNLDGVDDYATSGRPVMDTFQSFAVAAWVKLPKDKGDAAMTAVAQSSGPQRGFELYHSSSLGGWVFLRPTADSTDASFVRARQNACPPDNPGCPAGGLGSWSHVAGVYDLDSSQIRLYVNGELVDEQPFITPWLATGPVTLGSALASSGPLSHLRGQVDDVRMYDRAVSDDEVRTLYENRPVLTGRWKFDSATASITPDDLAGSNDLSLRGGAVVDSAQGIDGALVLDGVDDHAVSARVPFDTGQSYTASAWVQAAAVPSQTAAVLTVPGASKHPFELRYEPGANPETDPGSWVVTTASADGSTAVVARAENSQFFTPTEWNHVALVQDGTRRQLLLYVNGGLEQFTCADSDGDGTADDPNCEDRVSWSFNSLSHNSSRPLTVGGNGVAGARTWPGLVSDLWTFQGTLTASQIQDLATPRQDRPSEVPTGS
ncbi:LamG-like jellyroll fold domain-containing protein [Streptomyces sp. NA04227]|uniref:LamG-like jellyroll fold domain-containing protein n=1 Tax=Streptomyces sp. NA04227 TaxID=2742136 RepID=UPI0020CA5740|nr:LamG-like jellyroll fold domain-containing protein [Streptomyces sp. NA04227]